jgi:ribose-phosphate pyrophosphokinase
MSEVKIFSGSANPELALSVAQRLGMRLARTDVVRFSDGEIKVEIQENVRGKDAFIVQSTCAPANDHIMELIILADALRRASVNSITAVLPYFGYARQDRRIRSARVPISARVVADMFSTVGISRVITVDLHAEQIQGFFYNPVDNIYASPIILEDLATCTFSKELLFVSPDVGGVVRARAIAKRVQDSDLAIIDKRRTKDKVEVMNVIGNPKDRDCIIIDDIVDTANTLCMAAEKLKEAGAHSVVAYCTHPVLSDQAVDCIANSSLDELIVTDSIPLSQQAKNLSKIRQLSLATLIANTIVRVSRKQSVSSMFVEEGDK